MNPKKMPFYLGIIFLIMSFGLTALFAYRVALHTNTMNIFIFQYTLFAFIGTLLYTATYKANSTKDESNFICFLSTRNNKLVVISFLGIFSLLLFLLNNSIYTKPFAYYLLVSMAAVIIGIQIIGSKKMKNWVLAQIILLALVIHGSTYLINPYLTGPDVYAHWIMTSPIVESGTLDSASGTYYYYPLGHIFPAILKLITSFMDDWLAIAMLSLSLIMISLIYLIGKEIAGKRLGLMSMLLITISTPLIFSSVTYSIMIGSFSLVLLCIYAILKSVSLGSRAVSWIVFWVPASAIFFFHPVTVVALIFILGGNFIASRNFSVFQKTTPFASYLVSFIAYLMFVHFMLFQDIVTTLFIPSDATPVPMIRPGESVFYVKAGATPGISKLFYVETSLAYLGYAFMALFGTYGCLKWLENPNLKRVVLVASLGLLYLFPIFSLFGKSIEPLRFLSFISMLLVLPAGAGLLFLFDLKTNQVQKISIFVAILAIVSFSSVSSYLTNDNNEIFNDKIVVPTGHLTQAVIEVRSFLEILPNESLIYTDHRTLTYLGEPSRSIYTIPDKKLEWLKSAELLENEGFFVINIPNFEREAWATEDERYSFMDSVGQKSGIYDSGDVRVYYG